MMLAQQRIQGCNWVPIRPIIFQALYYRSSSSLPHFKPLEIPSPTKHIFDRNHKLPLSLYPSHLTIRPTTRWSIFARRCFQCPTPWFRPMSSICRKRRRWSSDTRAAAARWESRRIERSSPPVRNPPSPYSNTSAECWTCEWCRPWDGWVLWVSGIPRICLVSRCRGWNSEDVVPCPRNVGSSRCEGSQIGFPIVERDGIVQTRLSEI